MNGIALRKMLVRNPFLPFFFLLGFWMDCSCAFPLTAEEMNTISIYEKVAPSVVNITTAVCEPEFFLCSLPTSGTGSGIVIRDEGLVLTNYHVIANARDIHVTTEDGHRSKAEVVGSAPRDDLAVISIPVGDRRLKSIEITDSESLQVGEKVLAVGNPFGLGQTLTTGTVSMVGRDIKGDGMILRGLIQTDAAINPGNSGGALVNSRGQLVGMNTIILSPTGGSIGIGFAIPSNRINKVVPNIIHPWPRWLGWILALLLVFWIIRRIYRV